MFYTLALLSINPSECCATTNFLDGTSVAITLTAGRDLFYPFPFK